MVLRFFGREARAAGENGVNMSVIATQDRRMIPPLESVLPWPCKFAPGCGGAIPSVLGLELVGSDIVLDEAWKWGGMKMFNGRRREYSLFFDQFHARS
jgi:hypothetical protein